MLSRHEVTFATPRIANSMTIKAQLASCILNTPDDDTWSLTQYSEIMYSYCPYCGARKKRYNEEPVKLDKNRWERKE